MILKSTTIRKLLEIDVYDFGPCNITLIYLQWSIVQPPVSFHLKQSNVYWVIKYMILY